MTSPAVTTLPLHENAHTILSPSSPSSGGASLVQHASNTGTVGTTITVTLGTATTSGNCLVAYISAFQAATDPVVSGITLGGSPGNWVSASSLNVNLDTEIWVDWNCAGGQTSVVVTFIAGSGTNLSMTVLVEEYSGVLNGASPVDRASSGSGISAAPSSGTTATLSQASELLVGVIGAAATPTGPASPWTNESVITAGVVFQISGYQQVFATPGQAYAGTMASGGWGANIATLKTTAFVPAVTGGSGIARISPGQPGAPGSGVGATRYSGLVWNVTGVSVSVATNGKEATASCYISYGIQSNTPDDFQGQTQTGSTGDTCTVNASIVPGDWITVIWSGGDPGAIATMRVFGTVSPPGVSNA